MTTRETQHELYRVLKAHKSELEITRGAASGPDLEILDRRIEAIRLLLEWIWQALEPLPEASPAAQTPSPSRVQAGQDQTAQSASDPLLETSQTDQACQC
jgi:hypothetical protein